MGRQERRREVNVSMAIFVDFMLTCGTGRISAARPASGTRPPGFYAPVLGAIQDMHRMGCPTAALDNFLSDRKDLRERRIFPKVISGYKRFTRSARVTWFEPPMRDWQCGPLTVRVDPDLGLLIDGRPHAIKLHFGGAPIEPQRAMLYSQILTMALGGTWPGMTMATLDVRRAKLIAGKPKEALDILIRAESMCMAAIAQVVT